MKKIMVILLALGSFSAFAASEINLNPGAVAEIKAGEQTTVRCAPSGAIPRCSLDPMGEDRYYVKVGETEFSFEESLSAALNKITFLRDKGLCL